MTANETTDISCRISILYNKYSISIVIDISGLVCVSKSVKVLFWKNDE